MRKLQDRLGQDNKIALYLGDAVDAGERHGHVELRPEDLEHPLHARLPAAHQPPNDRPAEEDHPCTESEGLQHVGAQGDAAVEVYLCNMVVPSFLCYTVRTGKAH